MRVLAIVVTCVVLVVGSAAAESPPPEATPFVLRQPVLATLAVHVGGIAEAVHLEAAIYRPPGHGPFPLVIFNHGTDSRTPAELRKQRPDYVAPASWFVGEGYAVIIPMRRGYGNSDGPVADLPYGGNTGRTCAGTDYVQAGEESARDVLAVLAYARTLSYVDGSRIVLAGHSAGGWAVAAALEHAPDVLGGVIFAGGRGGNGRDLVCHPDRLVAAARQFGLTARAPSIWLYSDNDHFFSPALGHAMFDAFSAAHPNDDTFVELPAFGLDGHQLVGARDALPLWTPAVSDFLARIAPR